MPTAGWWEALWSVPRDVLVAVGISSDMEVVDLCSGNGWFYFGNCQTCSQCHPNRIDATLLEVARVRLVENRIANCSFVTGDAYDVQKLVGHPTDFVFIANTFHVVPDKPRLARAVCDRLKPNGRFAIINWHQRPREETTVLGEPRGPRTELRMSPKQTIDAVEQAGLRFVQQVELLPYHYAVVFTASSS